MQQDTVPQSALEAVRAFERGYTPVPIYAHEKRPGVPQWSRITYDDANDVETRFLEWTGQGYENLGLLLGAPSGGLVDVDLDHEQSIRLRDYFLPPTAMKSGRDGRRQSHYWYQVTGDLPGTRRYAMPGRRVSVELRSTGAQTVIPPSIHPTGERYLWEGENWGGAGGPLALDGGLLAVRVASLALASVLLDGWPKKGGRHDAYLALAGGLLRYGHDGGVHPFWEQALPALIGPLASATHDEDGAEQRIEEAMGTTLARLRSGGQAVGWPRLAQIIGEERVTLAKQIASDLTTLAGFEGETAIYVREDDYVRDERPRTTPTAPAHHDPDGNDPLPEDEGVNVDPLGARATSWDLVNLNPYLAGIVRTPEPQILRRDDERGLMYEGRVNMLYGAAESAKSWVAMKASLQAIERGGRVLYLDFEDEPTNTVDRLLRLGGDADTVRSSFAYLRPEDPIASMQRNRWGQPMASERGRVNQHAFDAVVESLDPTLIVADGMTALYGLHGLNPNDGAETDVITSWLKRLTRNGRSTVIVIDHSPKNPERGTLPTGSQHKVAMVQGTLLQVWPVVQPRRGALGEIDLIVVKDRVGSVRQFAADGQGRVQIAARVTMDSRDEAAGTVMTITEPVEVPPGVVEIDAKPRRQTKAQRAAEARRAREAEEAIRFARERERVLGVFGGDLDVWKSGPEIAVDLGVQHKTSSGKGDSAEYASLVKVLARLVEEGSLSRVYRDTGLPRPEDARGRNDMAYRLTVSTDLD